MYNPIQIPHALNPELMEHINYTEEKVPWLSDFVICLWEMRARTETPRCVDSVLLPDGCVHLTVNFNEKKIGFTSLSQINFHCPIELPNRYIGVKLKPGAFYQLTKIPVTEVVDSFLPVEAVCKNFDHTLFFSLPLYRARQYLIAFLRNLINNRKPAAYTTFLDEIHKSPPASTAELYQYFHSKPRQCQRIFYRRYGLSSKKILSILRFQRCLAIMTAKRVIPDDVLEIVSYYEQVNLIHDFKKNIGITPYEFIRLYQKEMG